MCILFGLMDYLVFLVRFLFQFVMLVLFFTVSSFLISFVTLFVKRNKVYFHLLVLFVNRGIF